MAKKLLPLIVLFFCYKSYCQKIEMDIETGKKGELSFKDSISIQVRNKTKLTWWYCIALDVKTQNKWKELEGDILDPDIEAVYYQKISYSAIKNIKYIMPNYFCDSLAFKYYHNSNLTYYFRFRLIYTRDFKLLHSAPGKIITVKCSN